MGQIDVILRFDTEAQALAAVDLAEEKQGDTWSDDHAMPVTVTRISTGLPVPGYFLWVSLTREEARRWQKLRDSDKVQLVIDRDLANAGVPRNEAIIKRTVTLAVLADMYVSPVYAGCDWGGVIWGMPPQSPPE